MKYILNVKTRSASADPSAMRWAWILSNKHISIEGRQTYKTKTSARQSALRMAEKMGLSINYEYGDGYTARSYKILNRKYGRTK